jgi:hypothetical protein|tara:strand:- start:71042 stop:71482 length:441 start_codon:yes stop_codon:yes gene_type:complete
LKTSAVLLGIFLLLEPLLIYASSGPGIGLPPRYLQPGSMTFRLPYDLAFNGGCLIDLAPQQVLLEFDVDRDGRVLSVQTRGSAPAHEALNALLQAARDFRFPKKFVEWEALPYSTVVALPLPSRGCWRPPLHEDEQRGSRGKDTLS